MKRINPNLKPTFDRLFRPEGVSQKEALWVIWKTTEKYFGSHDAKIVGDFLKRISHAEPEQDEPAVTVFTPPEKEGATYDETMAGIERRAHEMGIDTPEGMAKALELEPWEKK